MRRRWGRLHGRHQPRRAKKPANAAPAKANPAGEGAISKPSIRGSRASDHEPYPFGRKIGLLLGESAKPEGARQQAGQKCGSCLPYSYIRGRCSLMRIKQRQNGNAGQFRRKA